MPFPYAAPCSFDEREEEEERVTRSELWAEESQQDRKSKCTALTRSQRSDGMHSTNEEESIVGEEGKKTGEDDDDDDGFL